MICAFVDAARGDAPAELGVHEAMDQTLPGTGQPGLHGRRRRLAAGARQPRMDGGSVSPRPQLIMRRPHLRDLPAAGPPRAGTSCATSGPGDEAGWNALMDLAFERRPGQSDFTREMAADEALPARAG